MRVLLFSLLLTFSLISEPFDKVVIWGHKLHTHTHSYIHSAFYRAFKHLGYETYWLDEKDDLQRYNLSNTLFITEGQVDKKIPIRDDCYYFLHNCSDFKKYIPLREKGRTFTFQVYTDDVLKLDFVTEYAPFHYYSTEHRILFMPWGTDLLPHEINENKTRLLHTKKEKKIYWIGSIGGGKFGNIENIRPFKSACIKSKIPFIVKHHVSIQEHRDLIMRSYIAPIIVGPWQAKQGYIPCRIFKNISYGQMGVTNSKRAYEICEEKIVYDPDCRKLFSLAEERIEKTSNEEIFELMDFVRDHHTYINRIKFMLQIFQDSLSQ